jgi:uncharacterized protein
MNPVVHFEMPYEDKDRMAKFYQDIFGWKTQILGEDMGNYVVVETTENDPSTHRPKTPGAINGGFFKKAPEHANSTVVIAVDDIQDAMKKVEAGGGKPGEPDNIPGVGLYIAFQDTEGNRIALLQPNPMM